MNVPEGITAYRPGADENHCSCGRELKTTEAAGVEYKYCSYCGTSAFALWLDHQRAVAEGRIAPDGTPLV